MIDQDYLKHFDSADEQAAIEALANELLDDSFSPEDALLEDISTIEHSLDTEHIVDDFDKAHSNQNDSNSKTNIDKLVDTLAALKHQQQLHHQYFAKLRKQAAPHWQPKSK